MEGLILRLLPDNQEPQELVLQQHQLASSILDATNTYSSYVFNDYRYQAQLINADEEIHNLIFLLNGSNVNISYSPDSGMIEFQDVSFGKRIFTECYGFVQITLIFDDGQGNHFVRETEYIQVMVRKGRQNDSVQRMTKYIYEQNSEFLNSNKILPRDASSLKDAAQKTLEAHILLLERISTIYEGNYRYFKMNSRFSTVQEERIDYFEKLQYVSKNTLRYIVQHPEELQKIQHPSGIKVGSYRYQPNKTLVTNNRKSYDIYENRVVLGFLLHLLREINRIHQELSHIIDQIPQKPMETNDYITSSYFIYAKTAEFVKIRLQDMRDLQRKYTSLYYLYAEALPIKTEEGSVLPRFTPVFRSIPQYHQIYDCAVAWFSKGVFAIDKERFMLSFIKISTLYEIYVLTKLIAYFTNAGYSMAPSEKITYPSPGKYYESTSCDNYFVFQNDAGKVTLYYQPVIYNTDRYAVSRIGLYRNTSIPYPKAEEDVYFGGKYYTPDFLIKYEYAGSSSAKYLIADAKFSQLKTVKSREVAELAYKYLFSISPVSEDDQIIGLCIFNGQSNLTRDTYTNIYDFELSQRIMPRADIVTLTENSENNMELHEALLRNTVGLYVTEVPQKSTELPAEEEPSEAMESGVSITQQEPIRQQENETVIQVVCGRDFERKVSQPATEPLKKSIKTVQKKLPQKKEVDITGIHLSELNLDKEIELRLIAAGYITVQDLLPNKSKADLSKNTILNRKSRREIQARVKQQYKVNLK